MEFGAVTLVLAEAIFREPRAEVAHNRIAGNLRDHTRGRDREAVAIAVDDGGLGKRKWEDGEAVDEHVFRLNGESTYRDPHRLVARPQNVDRVDLDGIDNPDGPRDRVVSNQILVNLLALFWQKLL